MLTVTKQILEEKLSSKPSIKKAVKVKVLSQLETKALQDAVRVKYHKAFEMLKDR